MPADTTQESLPPEAASVERRSALMAALQHAVKVTPGDVILFSGGLDSSLLAALRPDLPVITVALAGATSHQKPREGGGCSLCSTFNEYPRGCGADPHYAKIVKDHSRLQWHSLQVHREEALAELQELMRVSQSYSLDLLNNITIYVGLKYARQHNWLTVWTGDDADTLFAGYGFKGDNEAWRRAIRAAIPRINPDATAIAKSLGITMAYPFLHPAVVEVAASLDLSDNIQWVEGDEPGNFYDQFNLQVMQRRAKPWGKAMLRHAAKEWLPDDILWRQKTHLMFGSAMCRLEWDLAHSVTEQDRREADAARTLDGSKRRCFISDVHRALYLLYIKMDLRAEAPREGEQPCEWCGAGEIIEGEYGYCRVCGAYPAKSRPAEYCPDDE